MRFTTTDGQIFDKRNDAVKHQRRLDAIAALATSLFQKFELDMVVGANIAAHLAEQPDELTALLGIVRRPRKAADGDTPTEDTAPGADDNQA